MVLPSAEEIAEWWYSGRLMMPPVPCPACSKKTMAKWGCQWCKVQWTHEQLQIREKFRQEIISRYDDEMKDTIRRAGYRI